MSTKTQEFGQLNQEGQLQNPHAQPGEILNIAAYKFVDLDDLENRRSTYKQLCDSLNLRGTILLSPEGINLFIAGEPADIDTFLIELRSDPHLSDIEVKESYSQTRPFRRMLVRLKKEIIAFGKESIAPATRTSPKLPAKELKNWLDDGKEVLLLDVRNDYEVELGTFKDAKQLDIGHFRQFPEAINQLPEEQRNKPVVMFCTGGIRCEKAGPWMEQAGFTDVYQLEGGILKYFEECGNDHYDGSCFVFDGRVAVDPALKPTGKLLCFTCRAVLDHEDVQSDRFSFGEYCPYCYEDPDVVEERSFNDKKDRLLDLARSQPGSEPYSNERRMHVPRASAGKPLIEFLLSYHPPTAKQDWESWLADGQITTHGRVASPDEVVNEGQCFTQILPQTVEPEINPEIDLLHEDEMILVVNKPASLPTHPSGRFNRNTLSWLLGKVYENDKLRPAHRLDADTSGIVVFCRKREAARKLQPQFAERTVKKVYLARVHGQPEWDETLCEVTLSNEVTDTAGLPTKPGSRSIAEEGQGVEATTSFRVLCRYDDGTCLVECIPHTGRTHQIRLHLAHLGHPIINDSLYADPALTWDGQPDTLLLHAKSLEFAHPSGGKPVCFDASAPAWSK